MTLCASSVLACQGYATAYATLAGGGNLTQAIEDFEALTQTSQTSIIDMLNEICGGVNGVNTISLSIETAKGLTTGFAGGAGNYFAMNSADDKQSGALYTFDNSYNLGFTLAGVVSFGANLYVSMDLSVGRQYLFSLFK